MLCNANIKENRGALCVPLFLFIVVDRGYLCRLDRVRIHGTSRALYYIIKYMRATFSEFGFNCRFSVLIQQRRGIQIEPICTL